MPFKFENLIVWQKSLELSGLVDETTKIFPKDELYVITTTQIKRASDSIALNIAEGSTGRSNTAFKKFLGYALRSAIEVVTLSLAMRKSLISQVQFNHFYNVLTEIIKMIQALRNSLS